MKSSKSNTKISVATIFFEASYQAFVSAYHTKSSFLLRVCYEGIKEAILRLLDSVIDYNIDKIITLETARTGTISLR